MVHSNRLSKESSPYLLQHASNPVDWYPWGDEALQRARAENKPILVSIGYSACHWCHVMEHESFEDENIAQLMNTHFINIKIDREERPDLDHIYMEAVQVISGSGGWPLNVFLTPEGKPFYGGTYFPPEKAFNRASWKDVLTFITRTWTEKQDEVLKQADILTQHISNSGNQMMRVAGEEEKEFNKFHLDSICDNLLKNADMNLGGFGSAPKFPQTMSIQFLLMYDHFFQNEQARDHALNSIRQMCRGGIYDHLAGGFARYSTDSKWLAPHFEKMLYDNALLILLMCDAFQITGDKFFQQYILHTIQFLQAEMKNSEGGYYAALDADSEGEEGKFYTWNKAEFDEVVGEDASLAAKWFGVKASGNWEGINILHQPSEKEEFCKENALSAEEFEFKLTLWVKRLLERRNARIRPGTDDKVLLGWNALLVSAYCNVFSTFGEEKFRKEAVSLMDFLLNTYINKDGELLHTYKEGVAKYPAFLDDYAYLIRACIHLQEITSNQFYLVKASELARYVTDNFSDENNLMFFFTGKLQNDVVVRKIDIHDGAVPSGNSIMAGNLQYLSIVFNEPGWNQRGTRMTAALKDVVVNYPTSFGEWAMVILKQVVGIEELVITGTHIETELKKLLSIYFPNKVLQSHTTPDQSALLVGKTYDDPHWIYRCKNYSCGLPVRTIEELGIWPIKENVNNSLRNK